MDNVSNEINKRINQSTHSYNHGYIIIYYLHLMIK